MIINLGSGDVVAADEIGVDIKAWEGVGVVCDLSHNKLPFQAGSIDVIRSHHCFEHLTDLVALMTECHRILKPGGQLQVTVPHFGAIGYWRDPTHVRPFAYATFDYFVRGRKPVAYTDVDFEYVTQKLRFGSGVRAFIGRQISKLSVRSWEKYYRTAFPALELKVTLRSLPPE